MEKYSMYPARGDPYDSIRSQIFGDLMGVFCALVLVLGGLSALPWSLNPQSPHDSPWLRSSILLESSRVSTVPLEAPTSPVVGFKEGTLGVGLPPPERGSESLLGAPVGCYEAPCPENSVGLWYGNRRVLL